MMLDFYTISWLLKMLVFNSLNSEHRESFFSFMSFDILFCLGYTQDMLVIEYIVRYLLNDEGIKIELRILFSKVD